MTDLESQIQLNRARVLIERGEKQAAYNLLQRVMSTNQRIPEAWFIASLLSDKESRRLEMLQKALKLRPDYPEAQEHLESILRPSDVPVTADLEDPTERKRPPELMPKTAPLEEALQAVSAVVDEDEYDSLARDAQIEEYEGSVPRRPPTRVTDTSEFTGDPLLQVAAYRYDEELAELERYQYPAPEEDVPADLDTILSSESYDVPDTSHEEIEKLTQIPDQPQEEDARKILDQILKSPLYAQPVTDDQESVDFPVVSPRATKEVKAAPAPRSTAELKKVKRTGMLQDPSRKQTGQLSGQTGQLQEPTRGQTGQLQEPTRAQTGQLQEPPRKQTGQLQEPIYPQWEQTAQEMASAAVYEEEYAQAYAPVETFEEAPTLVPPSTYNEAEYVQHAQAQYTDVPQVAYEEVAQAAYIEQGDNMSVEANEAGEVVRVGKRPPFPFPWTRTWKEIQASWLQGAADTGTQIAKFLQALFLSPLKLAIVVVWLLWTVWSPYTMVFYTIFLLALAYSPERPYVLETLDRWIGGVADYLRRLWAWLRYKG